MLLKVPFCTVLLTFTALAPWPRVTPLCQKSSKGVDPTHLP